jgi:hypothetical protein
MSDIQTAYANGPTELPPLCLRTHWDPTAVSQMILPGGVGHRDLALDPRPASMICRQYYTISPGDGPIQVSEFQTMSIPASLRGGSRRPDAVLPQVSFPPGGAAGLSFPYQGFNSQTESDLLRLRETLTKCAEKRYIPPNGVPASDMGIHTIPGADQTPHIAANVVKTSTYCRSEDDAAAWERSSRLFFNPTRYDRTTMVPASLKQAESKNALRC